jgi:hypothetical protein
MRRAPHVFLVIGLLAFTLLGGALLLAPAPASAAERIGGASSGTDDVAEDDGPAPAVAYDRAASWRYATQGRGEVTLEIPESSLPTTIEVWFEGVTTGASASIQVHDPEGNVVVDTSTGGSGNIQVSVLRSNEKSAGPANMPGGTWRVVFDGTSFGTGHARFHTT